MAKYLKITPSYKATSFEDRIKPLALYKEEYENQQEAFDKLLEDTAVLENLKNSEADADVYREYSTWRDSLNKAADDLSSTGVLNMQGIHNIRREYLNKLKPMEDKYKFRATQIAKQASESSPDVLFSKTFADIPVKDVALDDAYSSIKLSEVQKRAYDDAISKYTEDGLPDDAGSDIERLYGELDIEGFSNEDKQTIKNNLVVGYNKAAAAIAEYKQKQRLADAQIAKTNHDARKPYTSSKSTGTKPEKVSHVDKITGKKYTLYKKDGKLYKDQTYKDEFKEGEVTEEESIKYNGMAGISYLINSLGSIKEAPLSTSAVKEASLDSYSDYAEFMKGKGTPAQRSALNKIITDKKIDPRVLYAAGVRIIVHNDGGAPVIEIKKKAATPPPGN